MRVVGLIAGVDSSTQATKVVLVDPDDGRLVAQGQARHTVTGTGGSGMTLSLGLAERITKKFFE